MKTRKWLHRRHICIHSFHCWYMKTRCCLPSWHFWSHCFDKSYREFCLPCEHFWSHSFDGCYMETGRRLHRRHTWPWSHKNSSFYTHTPKSTNQNVDFHVSSIIFVVRALSKVLWLQPNVSFLWWMLLEVAYKENKELLTLSTLLVSFIWSNVKNRKCLACRDTWPHGHKTFELDFCRYIWSNSVDRCYMKTRSYILCRHTWIYSSYRCCMKTRKYIPCWHTLTNFFYECYMKIRRCYVSAILFILLTNVTWKPGDAYSIDTSGLISVTDDIWKPWASVIKLLNSWNAEFVLETEKPKT